MTFSKMEKIGMGLALCIVVGLFILMKYYDGLFHRVDNALEERFQTTGPTLQIRDKSGNVDVVRNGEAMFYKDDDVHSLMIKFPKALTVADYTIELRDLSAKQDTNTFTQSSPGVTLSSDATIITLKVALAEKTSYLLKVTTDVTVELPFKTGPHTFFYGVNPLSNKDITTTSMADRGLCLGISLSDPVEYKFNTTQSLNPSSWTTNAITYTLRKPDADEFKIYTLQKSINQTQTEIEQSRLTLSGFEEYMPYSFDIQLEFYRTPDDMPNENVNKPDINCQTTTPCKVIITGLRKEVDYTLRTRLIYFKPGTQNFRSTPEIAVTFKPTVGGDTEMSTLTQIKQLLKSVKQQTVNINMFNKYQMEQDAKLDELESRFYSTYKF